MMELIEVGFKIVMLTLILILLMLLIVCVCMLIKEISIYYNSYKKK